MNELVRFTNFLQHIFYCWSSKLNHFHFGMNFEALKKHTHTHNHELCVYFNPRFFRLPIFRSLIGLLDFYHTFLLEYKTRSQKAYGDVNKCEQRRKKKFEALCYKSWKTVAGWQSLSPFCRTNISFQNQTNGSKGSTNISYIHLIVLLEITFGCDGTIIGRDTIRPGNSMCNGQSVENIV